MPPNVHHHDVHPDDGFACLPLGRRCNGTTCRRWSGVLIKRSHLDGKTPKNMCLQTKDNDNKNSKTTSSSSSSSNNKNRSDDRYDVETLIVGFGFSCIPLLRELHARGQDYVIISAGQPIWQQLAKANRLDFELVSSVHASFYTKDLVAMGKSAIQDRYPTAREFYEYHERIFDENLFRTIVDDTVELIENFQQRPQPSDSAGSSDDFGSYSLVHTRSRKIYKAKYVVCATGLGRPQNETIKDLDVKSIRNKTLVFTTTGDTSNMMLSRAVPQGNKCILVNNGFCALEKMISFDAPGPAKKNGDDPAAPASQPAPFVPILGIRPGKH